MKKTISAVLIVALVVTPCLALEVESDKIFSLHGTAWENTAIISIVFPDPPFNVNESFDLGFYGGKVYVRSFRGWSAPNPFSCYIDLLVASFYVTWYGLSMSSGILLPNGKGISIGIAFIPFIAFAIHEASIINDNWTPPEPEVQ